MRSEGDAPARRRRALRTRVIASAMASGALAGTLSAVTAVAAVDQLVSRRGDQRLRGAADVLAGEIDEGSEELEWEPIGEIVADENEELVTSGVRLAVFSGDHRIAGDPWVKWTPPGECATHGPVGRRERACGRAYRDWTLVAAAQSDDAAQNFIYVAAALAALALGAGCGAVASFRLTSWALRPLSALNAALRDFAPDRSDPGALGPASDCEEVEQIRDALHNLLRRSRALLGQAQRFAADAAHELRTPLTVMRGEIELLLEETGEASSRAALARIGRRARKLEELVERLGERGEAVALADVVQEAADDLAPELRRRIRLDLRGEGLVRGDPALLGSMVANALDNALKFSGDEPVKVVLEELADTGAGSPATVRVEIRDRGPGVAPEQRERVFEPFYRARPDAAAGHGLGLSLIGHVARTHGGAAAFVDAERGACLQLTLPAWSPPPAEAPRDMVPNAV